MKGTLSLALVAAAMALLAAACQPSGPKVDLTFHVMSQCPYGVKVVDTMAEVLPKIGDRVNFTYEVIGDQKEGKLTSMHGDSEVFGDKIYMCAQKHYGKSYTYMPFLTCMNKKYRELDKIWEKCATDNKIDAARIKACAEGAEGTELVTKSFEASKAKQAQGSPTIFLAGERYNGSRSASGFMRAICDKMVEPKHPECAKIPAPVKFTVTVLNDQRCEDCQNRARGIEGQMKRMFESAEFKTVDYATDEGKKLFEATQVKLLPAFLFEKAVEKSENYENVQRWLTPAGDFLSLRVGAKFDPTREICDNKTDDTGDGKIDCDDEQCKGDLACRAEIPKKIDLFIMSQCPYGVKAVDAMKGFFETMPKQEVLFDVHFIATETEPGKFQALHGQPEVDENIRELCAKKFQPKDYKYLDYFWCRSKDIRSADWEPCAKEAGLDVAKMKACAEGPEGIKLHSDDIKLAQELQIQASPTWLANNRYKFSGITAKAVQDEICKRNPGLKGCDKPIAEDPAAAKVKGSCN